MNDDRPSEEPSRTACDGWCELLSEYEAGELTAHLAARVEEHLGECPACACLLSALRQTSTLVDQLVDEDPARTMAVRVLGKVDELSAPDFSDAPEIMTPDELARFLRVPPDTLAEVIDTIPGFDIGGEVRFRKERVVEWIDQREHERDRRAIYSRLRAI